MMTMRKQNKKENSPETDDGHRSGDEDGDRLPVRSDQSRELLDSPKESVKVVIERGADLYFSACRRIAELLNRRD